MRRFFQKSALLSLSFFLIGTFAHADTLRIIKVYLIKSTKPTQAATGVSAQTAIDSMEVDVPTDDEMNTALEALKKAGIKPEDLVKNEDHAFMLESFMFEVKRAVPGANPTKQAEVNGVLVEKSTDDDLEKQRNALKGIKDFLHFFDPFEMQFGLGGAFPFTYGLAHSYHIPFSFTFGIGYQFSPNFSLLLNLDGNFFNSSNDGLTNGGYQFQEGAAELLFKVRFASKSFRPYVFAGPALGFSEFQYSISNNSTFNNLSVSSYGSNYLSDNGHFAMVGGLGFEVGEGSMRFYLQTEVIDDFIGSNVASFANLDQPIVYLPIEAGVVFSR